MNFGIICVTMFTVNSAARDIYAAFGCILRFSISIILRSVTMAENKDFTATELPWLIFTLCGNAFAVNSEYVNGIEMKSEKITPLPQAPDIYCGMVERRGDVYPLLNMRKVFGFKSLDEELGDFKKLVEDKIAEEKAWFKNLVSQLENGGNAHIMKEQNNSKFFDKLTEYNSALSTKIEKAKGAYNELSGILNEIPAAAPEEKETLLNRAKNEAFRNVLTTLDGIVKAQENSFRETVVVLTENDNSLGLLVDQVLAVDKIYSVSGSERMRTLMQSKYFLGVAKNEKIDLEILIINDAEFLKLSEVEN